ncbi:MAG TPA: ribonuclease P protein component [Longimicrobiales bacterium]|nr:ribonuclease P protein component [Longimicrobiales bacterium]
MRQRLPRTRRITSSREIRALLQQGKRSKTAHLDVFDSASPFSFSRVGVIVPKHRRNSVERNRLKRRLREVLRTEIMPRMRELETPADIMVRARREAYVATFTQLRDELLAWAERKWSHAL